MTDDKGIRVISRAGSLLRALGAATTSGSTTTELAAEASISRPTAHRLLTALAGEGLVDRDDATGRWMLGPELYLLGSSAANRYDIADRARDIVDGLARDTGESAFLSAMRGDETVCVLSQEGSFPLRSHVLYEGIRFPLGVASAGLAILSHLPDREIDDYLARTDLVDRWGESHSQAQIRRRIASTRRSGYAVNPGLLVEGSWGMAAAVFDRRGRPGWALSLTGVQTRFRADRRRDLGTRLMQKAHELGRRLHDRH
ncbi:IclR family transcriptional regulator [Gordonia sp. TBRC 11910]|uniref:IclR family transcriptional regulator n=1 Tax=Gordonia asplenii TaxID=2725283 RepID=A0A848KPW2_9ACTN|nr:IclR family transcriptional regulator [Gordonia asplenii]NMO00059.1 IclR family transcriptional regulator [Gordonia asplenii]